MRRSYPVSIGSLWDEIVSGDSRMSQRLVEARLPDVWRKVVGEPIASATSAVDFNNGILTVYIASSVLRNEVFMRRMELAEAINAISKKRVVNYITVK